MVKPKDGFGKANMVRLWVHESLRVFGDRLVDDPDREWFLQHLNSMVRETGETIVAGVPFDRCVDPRSAAVGSVRVRSMKGDARRCCGLSNLSSIFAQLLSFGRNHQTITPARIILFRFNEQNAIYGVILALWFRRTRWLTLACWSVSVAHFCMCAAVLTQT